MRSHFKSACFTLITGALLVPYAQAGDVAPQPDQASLAGHCLDAAGLEEVQPIRELARQMSPDVIMDRVFSAVAPEVQNALLSRPAGPGKPARRPETLRDPKFFLPAIAIMEVPFNWLRVRADGSVIESAGAVDAAPGWIRAAAPQQKNLALPQPQRY